MADRLKYIGGSDIVKLMGVSEYGTWVDVWNRFKQGVEVPLDPEEKRDLLRGQVVEPECERYIRAYIDPTINDYNAFQAYCIENDPEELFWDPDDGGNVFAGDKLNRRTQVFAQDRIQPYLCGHIDGVSDDCIYEMKAPRIHNIKRMDNEGVKREYLYQCQFYMMITGKPRGVVAIWDYDSWTPMLFPVRRDPDIQREMRAVTRNFWEALESDLEMPDLHWQRKMGYEHVYDHEELDTIIGAFVDARAQRSKMEDSEATLKPMIMTAVNEIWQEGEKTCQFLTSGYHVRATKAIRGETEYVTLTCKSNDVKAKIPTA